MAEYIDRTLLEPDTEWSEYYDDFISYSQSQINSLPTADVIERSKIDKVIEEIKHLTIYHKTTQGSELVSRKAVLRTINKYLGE
jgi:hypothetical protein